MVYTDFIQAIILIGGSTVLTVRALIEVGGWTELVAQLQQRDATQLLSMVRPPTDSDLPFTGFLLGNFLIGGMFYWCMDQVNVQRVLGARNVHHARGGALLAAVLKIVPVFIMVLPGLIATVLYSDQIDQPKHTYSVLVKNLLPVGLRGFVLAALIAALMSSLSSSFNSVSCSRAFNVSALRWDSGCTTSTGGWAGGAVDAQPAKTKDGSIANHIHGKALFRFTLVWIFIAWFLR